MFFPKMSGITFWEDLLNLLIYSSALNFVFEKYIPFFVFRSISAEFSTASHKSLRFSR